MFSEDGKQLSHEETPYSFSSRDLMSIEHLPALIEAGVDSLKIEGRMKSIHYIATVVGTYRKLIDDYFKNSQLTDLSIYLDEIKKAENRLTAEGFLAGKPTENEQLYNLRSEQPTQEFIGLVVDYNKETKLATVEQRNYFERGEVIEVYRPGFNRFEFTLETLYDEKLNPLDVARHPKQLVMIACPFEVGPYDLFRRKREWKKSFIRFKAWNT